MKNNARPKAEIGGCAEWIKERGYRPSGDQINKFANIWPLVQIRIYRVLIESKGDV